MTIHDDVIKWNHFPRYWPFARGIHRSPVNSPHKGQWRGALIFTLICTRINGWVNNREAGDLRRYRGHYDVTVMIIQRIDNISKERSTDSALFWFFKTVAHSAISKLIMQNSSLGFHCEIALGRIPQNPINEILAHVMACCHGCTISVSYGVVGPQ